MSVKWSFLIALLLHSMFHGYIKDFVSQGLQAGLGRVKTVQVMFYSASLLYFIGTAADLVVHFSEIL